MATAVESPSQLCMCAEQALLLSDYSGTVAYAQRCLASGSIDTPVKERALVAALQALFEQGRASAARRLLSDCYPCLEDVPPNALLLWLALAVDSEHAEEAKQAMRALLSSCQPGSAAGWRRAQYLSLLHLYVHEALQPERRDAAEVVRWVQTTELPVTPEERQLLLDELAAQQAGQQRSEAAAQLPGVSGVSGTAAAGGAAAAAVMCRPVGEAGGGRARQAAPEQMLAADQAAARAATTAAAPAIAPAPAGPGLHKPRLRWQWPEPEIVPVFESSSEAEGSSGASGTESTSAVQAGVEWLCQAQQQALEAAAALVRPLLGGPPAGKQGSRGAYTVAHFSPDPAQLAGGTVLGAVLLYALYVEQQSIRRGARWARQAVASGAVQLLRMAFSLSINPVATSAPAWR